MTSLMTSLRHLPVVLIRQSCRSLFLLCLAATAGAAGTAHVAAVEIEAKVELLWPQGAPGAKGEADGDKPSLTIYPAAKDKANGAAVVICPGGGYG